MGFLVISFLTGVLTGGIAMWRLVNPLKQTAQSVDKFQVKGAAVQAQTATPQNDQITELELVGPSLSVTFSHEPQGNNEEENEIEDQGDGKSENVNEESKAGK